MGQISATPLRGDYSPEQPNWNITQAQRAQTQAVVSAVNVINKAGIAGSGREVTYSKDSGSKSLVIQLVDKESGKVIVQWPSAYAIEMAQDYQKEHPEK
jgi:uncharacterized FlaG/YvyC family protein